MKRLMAIAMALALAFSLAACTGEAGSNEKGEKKEDNKQVEEGANYAVVNGYEVKQAEYDKYYDLYLNMLAEQNKLKDNVKDMFLDEAILKTELEKNGVEITEEDIENTYNSMIEDMGGEENYNKMLKENSIPVELYKKFAEIQAYREKHMDWYEKNNPVSEDEINKYYEENKMNLEKYNVSHILVADEKECKDIKKRLNEGEDFAKLAKECSTCPSKETGGELGEVSPASPTYDKDFLNAMNQLEVGQVSEPVKSQFGWHIIKVNSKKTGVETFRDEIVRTLSTKNYITFFTELKNNAEIKMENE